MLVDNLKDKRELERIIIIVVVVVINNSYHFYCI